MSNETLPFVLRNLRDQPTELYFGDRVVIVPPRGEVGLSEADRSAAQVRVLERRRLIKVRPRDRKIALDTATAAQLDKLPGISAATARAIVAYRVAHGPFSRLEDLQGVTGIGPATVNALRDHVVLRR